jgi:hypothetical protein
MGLMRLLPLSALLAVCLVGCSGDESTSSTKPRSRAATTSSGTADAKLLLPRPQARGQPALEAIFDRLFAYAGDTLEGEYEMFAAATRGQRAVYALWIVDGEVNNGGFEQFFFNSSGSVMDEAIDGAELIGASANARILEEAAEVFSDGDVPEDREARWRILDALPDDKLGELGELDDRWFSHDRELNRKLVAYVEANPEEFFR